MLIRDKLLSELHELSKLRALEDAFLLEFKVLSDPDFAFLAESIDDSDYSVQEWLIALHEFYQVNLATHTPRTIRFQIEYLNCCAEGSVQGGGKLLSLADLFLDYSNLYGIKTSM